MQSKNPCSLGVFANALLFFQDLKSAFRPFNLLLTAAVAVGEKTIKVAYDIPSIHKYLDFISLMAYGMTGDTFFSNYLYPYFI
jgi:Glycosyl hydrolases family 18